MPDHNASSLTRGLGALARDGPRSTLDHALEGLRHAILIGELRPGRRVNQEEIAQALGVSVAPVREALRTLEQEGQVTYVPRRGYFVTELSIAEVEEIYGLRSVLEEIAVRRALPALEDEDIERLQLAADECAAAAAVGDIAAELAANRRFHFAIIQAPGRPHTHRVIRLLWDSTEAYRALYCNSAAEREHTTRAHALILEAIRRRDVDGVIAELDDHRQRALDFFRQILVSRTTNSSHI